MSYLEKSPRSAPYNEIDPTDLSNFADTAEAIVHYVDSFHPIELYNNSSYAPNAFKQVAQDIVTTKLKAPFESRHQECNCFQCQQIIKRDQESWFTQDPYPEYGEIWAESLPPQNYSQEEQLELQEQLNDPSLNIGLNIEDLDQEGNQYNNDEPEARLQGQSPDQTIFQPIDGWFSEVPVDQLTPQEKEAELSRLILEQKEDMV